MAGTTWRVLLFFGIPLVFAMPPNGMEGGVPLSGDMPQFRQDTPAEDFSGGFSKDFALNLPTNEFLGNFHDVKAAKENSVGFIVGVPNNFPLFSSVGGFEPMLAQDKGDEGASFVPEFQPPVVVEFADIPDDQPKFQRPAFAQQVSDVRKELRQRETFQQEPDTVTEDEHDFRIAFPTPDPTLSHDFQSDHPHQSHDFQSDHPHQSHFSPIGDGPFKPLPPPPRPPSRPLRGQPKRPTRSPFNNFLKPFRFSGRRPRQQHARSNQKLFQ